MTAASWSLSTAKNKCSPSFESPLNDWLILWGLFYGSNTIGDFHLFETWTHEPTSGTSALYLFCSGGYWKPVNFTELRHLTLTIPIITRRFPFTRNESLLWSSTISCWIMSRIWKTNNIHSDLSEMIQHQNFKRFRYYYLRRRKACLVSYDSLLFKWRYLYTHCKCIEQVRLACCSAKEDLKELQKQLHLLLCASAVDESRRQPNWNAHKKGMIRLTKR